VKSAHEEVVLMRRYLVVANQTLGGEHLTEKVKELLAGGPCRFHILVPATAPRDHAVYTEGEAEALARRRLDDALARFRDLGAEADGEVGDATPLEAIADVLRDQDFDAILLSTLPPNASRWLKQDLPHRVERSFGLPVTHIVGQPEPVPEG
jgi:nucleotide-binding universal stress UspA family protein